MPDVGGLLLLAFPLLLLGLLLLRARGQQRRVATAQAEVEPGRRVMMTSGVFGDIVSVADDTVVVEVAPGVSTTWVRQAVARVLPPPAAEPGPVPQS